jgi:hypothetical protein
MKNKIYESVARGEARAWLTTANQICAAIYNKGDVTKEHYELMLKENKTNYDRRITKMKANECK